MGYKTNYNERSWSIDLIGHIKAYVHSIDRPIKEAGGETSIIQSGSSLFPDVLLFADSSAAKILQGWELKMPDTSINDKEFYENAKKKAKVLGLDSFILWNVKAAHMYVLDENSDDYKLVKAWDEIPEIISRTDVQKNVKKWKSLAISIIDTVNDYIDDGCLKGKRFIEAYSSGGITSLILENTNILSDSIQKKSNSDKLFRAKVQQITLHDSWGSLERYVNLKKRPERLEFEEAMLTAKKIIRTVKIIRYSNAHFCTLL